MKKLSPLKNPFVLLTASLACLAAFGQAKSEAAPVQSAPAVVRLPGHVASDIVRRSALLGRKSGSDLMPLALTLPLRNPAGLDRLLQRQYTPGDPLFHHFITPAEFTARFSPTTQTYASVAAFAAAHGLSVTHTHATRMLLEVSGPVSNVEAAFHVHLQNFQSPEGRIFHAPDADPAIPVALAGKLAGVVGLQNTSISRPHSVRRPEPLGLPQTTGSPIGSGPGGGLTPTDIKAAYDLSGTTLTGQGQTLGLFELDTYAPSDISSYEISYSLPAVPLQNVPVSGGVGVPGNGAGEVTLDIELMASLAPGAKAIYVYEAPNDNTGATTLALYTQIAQDNIAKEVSSSWGIPEKFAGSDVMQMENTLFKQMAAQGQSLYIAAGDTGAYDDGAELSVDDPATQPYATSVGGTSLNVVSQGGAYQSESAWSDPTDTRRSPFGAGGGGGISTVWPIPDFQNGVPGLASTSKRNVPDVTLDADFNTGYSIYLTTDPAAPAGFNVYGGTSCAAPLWAAFTALVNQQREAGGGADLGFANQTIYQIAGSKNYKDGFHDILDHSTNLFYEAVPGYDNATGWGSFDGAGLLALMAPAVAVNTGPVSSLTLTPSSVVGGLTSSGVVTLANPAPVGGASVTLTLASGPASAPATVLVAAGGITADFTVTTTAVTAAASVSVTAAYSGGTQSAALTILPPPSTITPSSLTLDPDTIGGGVASVGTVILTGPAPAGGSTVTLASSDPSATVPATVVVPAGAVSTTFPITTVPVTTQVQATISATLNGSAQTAVLTVQAPALKPLLIAPQSVLGGDSAVLTLTLTLPAPAGGAAVTLTSSDPAAVLPASVVIPAGQSSVPVTVTTLSVPMTDAVMLSAAYAGVTQTTTLTVKAALLQGVSLAPSTIIGGLPAVVTVTLGSPAPPTGLSVALTSSDPAAPVPATLAVPPGGTAASFALQTAGVTVPVTVTITATVGQTVESAALTIQPIQVASLALAPDSVLTGTPALATLTLNAPAPAGGLSVALSSSSKAATVPAAVVIPAGSATATFSIATPHAGSTVISATLAGASQTANLTVIGAPGTSYPAGLNLISAPYDYSGVSLDTLFGYAGVTLASQQPATGAYLFTPSAPADSLHLGHGYWINLPTAVTLSSVGTPADPTQDFSIPLSPGWNQIGQPWTTGETLSSLMVSSGGTPVPFDQATTAAPLLVSSLVYRYAPGQSSSAGGYIWVRDSDSLQPGLGYWIYAYQAVTLIVPRH